MNEAGVVARHSLAVLGRERTVTLLVLLLLALVLLSAWLGWSATSTVNDIYAVAAESLRAAGRAVPPNPVNDISPLGLLRNLSIYIALIGALAAIVVGYQLIASDRQSGAVPLIGVRPLGTDAYAGGKILALAAVVALLTFAAFTISALTLWVLPTSALDAGQRVSLVLFFVASALYLFLFGLLSMGCTARASSESGALMVPVTLWLTLTFILPALTSNVNPTAALNPVSSLAPAPAIAFFEWSDRLLGPLSIADAYKRLAAITLDFLPPEAAVSFALPVASLIAATCAALFFTGHAVRRMDMTRGRFDA